MRHSNIQAVTQLVRAAHQVQVDRAQHALCSSRAKGPQRGTAERKHADQTSNGANKFAEPAEGTTLGRQVAANTPVSWTASILRTPLAQPSPAWWS